MKKLLREEKIVSVPESILISVLIFTFLFLSNISAQIPIKGFCRYREFSVKANFSNVFGVDYSSDGFRDLLVASSNQKKYLTLTADDKSNFRKVNERFSPYVISDLHPMTDNNNGRLYLILSRKNRQVGIASFTKNGSILWKNKIKFNGYPSKIDVGDVDDNGKRVGLVSGNSLDGLRIIKQNKNNLLETQIAKGRAFVYSNFIDFDYDKFSDIIAFDAQKNSFIFFYNNHYGGFTESRSIAMTGDVREFSTADFNSDGFTDLVYLHNNRLEILLGDSVSSFQKKFVLDTPVVPDKYVIQDFNGDGFNDVAFLNKQSGELYISYAKGTNSFYPPILYMKKKGLIDLTAYVDRGGKKLVALSADGKLYLINAVRFSDDDFSISLGLKPGAAASFDYLNDKFKDICYIDKEMLSLNLLISERRNLFRTFYSIPLPMAFDEMEIYDSNERQKTFFLYKKGDRTIEAIRVTFDRFGYTKRTLYADGPVEDLKLSADRKKDKQTIYALIKKDGQLILQNFDLRDFKEVSTSSNFIANNVLTAKLALGDYREIYFWSKTTNEIDLKKLVFDKKVISQNNLATKKLLPKEKINLDLVSLNKNYSRSKSAAAMVSSLKGCSLYFINKNQVSNYPIKYKTGETPQLKYYLDRSDSKRFFCYVDKLGKLQIVSIDINQKLTMEKNLVKAQKINDYSIEEMSAKRTFFIYSDDYQNTLTFQKF